MNDILWISKPRGLYCDAPSLFGFSISIDESKGSAFVGAPGCNGLYECQLNGASVCQDLTRKIYSTNNPGLYTITI